MILRTVQSLNLRHGNGGNIAVHFVAVFADAEHLIIQHFFGCRLGKNQVNIIDEYRFTVSYHLFSILIQHGNRVIDCLKRILGHIDRLVFVQFLCRLHICIFTGHDNGVEISGRAFQIILQSLPSGNDNQVLNSPQRNARFG